MLLKEKTDPVCYVALLKIEVLDILMCFWQYLYFCLLCSQLCVTLTMFRVSKKDCLGIRGWSKQNNLHN